MRCHWYNTKDPSHKSYNAFQISHNAPFCNKNVHISVTKLCTMGHGTGALWDLWIRFIDQTTFINMARSISSEQSVFETLTVSSTLIVIFQMQSWWVTLLWIWVPSFPIKWLHLSELTHWGRVTHMCIHKLTLVSYHIVSSEYFINVSCNGLSSV